jgi:branched-chain amino acid transport system permease protein
LAELNSLVQYVIYGVTLGAIYAIVALGFTTIFSVTGIINFAQGEFVMLGGMVSFWLIGSFGLPAWLAFPAAIILVALLGFVLDRAAIRPAKNPSTVSLIIITIGASILIKGLAGHFWGKDSQTLPAFTEGPPLNFLGTTLTQQRLWVIGITVVLMLAVHLFYSYTIMGKAAKASAINRHAASLVGIDVRTMSLLGFVMAAGAGAVAGIIIAPIAMTSYDVGTMLGLKGFAAAALGGMNSSIGAIVGGLILGVLESLGTKFSSEYKDVIAFVVLLIVLFVKPDGIMGGFRRKT